MIARVNLARFLKGNRTKRVKQLSELSTLLRKEEELETQLKQIDNFSQRLSEETELSGRLRNSLPTRFVEEENKKRDLLLNSVERYQAEIEKMVSDTQVERETEKKKLQRLECQILKVEGIIKKGKVLDEIGRDIIESEET